MLLTVSILGFQYQNSLGQLSNDVLTADLVEFHGKLCVTALCQSSLDLARDWPFDENDASLLAFLCHQAYSTQRLAVNIMRLQTWGPHQHVNHPKMVVTRCSIFVICDPVKIRDWGLPGK